MYDDIVVVFHVLWVGPANMTAACRRAGVPTLPPFDIASYPAMDYNPVGRKMIREERTCPWFAPPCRTFSLARTTARVSRRRSLEKPEAPDDDMAGVVADRMFSRVIEDCIWVHQQGRPFVLDHPWSVYAWAVPITKRLLSLPGIVRAKVMFCAFGAPYQKPTGLATNLWRCKLLVKKTSLASPLASGTCAGWAHRQGG